MLVLDTDKRKAKGRGKQRAVIEGEYIAFTPLFTELIATRFRSGDHPSPAEEECKGEGEATCCQPPQTAIPHT